MKKGCFMLLLFLLLAGPARACGSSKLQPLLRELDKTLAQSETYIALRERRIDSLKRRLNRTDLSPATRFGLTEQLVDSYNAYQSDSARLYLRQCLSMAECLDDCDLIARTQSRLALNFSLSGRFYEAETILKNISDTLRLSRSTLLHYYMAQHRKNRELANQTGTSERMNEFRSQELYYARCAAEVADDAVTRLYYTYMVNILGQKWDAAEASCDSLLRILPPDSHDYAKAANHKAFLVGRKGLTQERLQWYIRSAIADIRSAVRDHGSLCSLCGELLQLGEVDRPMGYLQRATNDTQFFNSQSRSWRDMAVLPQIMSAYSERNTRLHTMYVVLLIGAFVFLVSAVFAGLYVLRQNRKLHIAHQNMRKTNERLNELTNSLQEKNRHLNHQNLRIADANRIKEVYIGVFLQIISEYINKLSASYTYVNKMLRDGRIDELRQIYVRSNVRNEELKEFYHLFDRTFLQLFPSFVAEMNNLLDEEARVKDRNGEELTTSLRIFALVRLGITDTATIASLLHCSIHTVYSYRSFVKRHARPDIGDFEQHIQSIGIQDIPISKH